MDGSAAIHVAGLPLLPVSTDSWALDTLVNRRVNVAAKSRPEPTQSVAGRSADPRVHLACGLAPCGLRVTDISVVTLSLVEFQMFL
jgi:hypothetical protein